MPQARLTPAQRRRGAALLEALSETLKEVAAWQEVTDLYHAMSAVFIRRRLGDYRLALAKLSAALNRRRDLPGFQHYGLYRLTGITAAHVLANWYQSLGMPKAQVEEMIAPLLPEATDFWPGISIRAGSDYKTPLVPPELADKPDMFFREMLIFRDYLASLQPARPAGRPPNSRAKSGGRRIDIGEAIKVRDLKRGGKSNAEIAIALGWPDPYSDAARKRIESRILRADIERAR